MVGKAAPLRPYEVVYEIPSGGIGDALYWMSTDGRFESLSMLAPKEHGAIINRCRTPGVNEFFKWHPKHTQIDFYDLSGHLSEDLTPSDREALGLPYPTRPIPPFATTHFYPSPEDKLILNDFYPKTYVVFGLSGSFDQKNVPKHMAERAASRFLAKGYKVLVIGKTYARKVLGDNRIVENARNEVRLDNQTGVFDLIDRLSLPGSIELVRYAAASFVCDSSMMHASWLVKTPAFVGLPNTWIKAWEDVNFASWGKAIPSTGWSSEADFDEAKLNSWMDKNNLRGTTP